MKSTLSVLKDQLSSGHTSARVLVEEAQARYQKGGDDSLFTLPLWEKALIEADVIDELRKSGNAPSVFAGIPITIKDLFDLQGQVTTAGSRALADGQVAASTAPCIQHLLDYGFIVLGRVNMTEFAFSGLGLNPHFGTPANPHDQLISRIPGGSSSGAAVSVASGLVAASIGTDTGGSVRIPASLCGLTGFKPANESVDCTGAIPLSTTLDSIGPLCNSVQCCADMYHIMSAQTPGPLSRKSVSELRILVPENIVWDDTEDGVSARAKDYLRQLQSLGATVEWRALELLDEILDSGAQGWIAGYESHQWHKALMAAKGDEYDPRVLSRIANGAGIPEDQYQQALRDIAGFRKRFAALMSEYDLLAYPATARTAPAFSELEADDDYSRINLLLLRNTAIGNVLNASSISLPMPGDDLPAGIMFSRPAGGEIDVLNGAYAIEQEMTVS